MRSQAEKRLYWVWGAMVQRCHNPRSKGYPNYGAKGIRVCDRWRSSANFLADMGLPPHGASIERNDSRRGYEPSNCRWATRLEQNNNRPSWCRYYTIDGDTLTMKEAWKRHAHESVTYRSFVKRLVSRDWDIQSALREPAGTRRAA